MYKKILNISLNNIFRYKHGKQYRIFKIKQFLDFTRDVDILRDIKGKSKIPYKEQYESRDF